MLSISLRDESMIYLIKRRGFYCLELIYVMEVPSRDVLINIHIFN